MHTDPITIATATHEAAKAARLLAVEGTPVHAMLVEAESSALAELVALKPATGSRVLAIFPIVGAGSVIVREVDHEGAGTVWTVEDDEGNVKHLFADAGRSSRAAIFAQPGPAVAAGLEVAGWTAAVRPHLAG